MFRGWQGTGAQGVTFALGLRFFCKPCDERRKKLNVSHKQSGLLLKSLACVLPAKYSHDLGNITAHAIVIAVNAANTATIAFTDMVYRLIFVGRFGNVAKALDQGLIVTVSL